MKKFSALRMLAMLPMLFAALTAGAQETVGISAPTMSDCKANHRAPSRTSDIEEGEWMDYSVEKREDGLYLHFIHENLYLNCATSGVELSATIEGNVITICENEIYLEGQAYADCLCPFDVTYDVGPLQEGDYTLVVTFSGQKIAEMNVHVSEPLRGRFNIGEFVTKLEKAALTGVKESEIIYDLQGRRYETFPFPGVFIQNGKKIIWTGK